MVINRCVGVVNIEFDELVGIADHLDEFQHICLRNHQRCRAVIGVETHLLGLEQLLVDKERNLVILIVDECEERHAAGTHAEVLHHALL